MDHNRTVHGRTSDSLIVRYDRTGKYYQEFAEGSGRKRRALTLKQAVELAAGGTVYLKRAGGLRFDAEYAKLTTTTTTAPSV